MIRRIFCILLISFGAGLDAYFYVFRFLADGTNLFVALSAALALELLLAFAVWNAQKSKLFTAVAVAITFYAVVQTSAGQTFSLLSRDAAAGDQTGINQTLIDEEKKNLARLDAESATITKQLSSIQTTEDRAAYGLTIGRMTYRLSELARDRNNSSQKISLLSDKNGKSEIVRVKNMSIYDFYASMTGWHSMDWLKFLFHTFLSILLAIMTPIGLLTWDPKSAGMVLKKSGLTEKEVNLFVTKCWKAITSQTGDKIISESSFYDWCERENIPVSSNLYKECASRALRLGIVTRERVALISDTELVKTKILGK
jgi:hypothetical protein